MLLLAQLRLDRFHCLCDDARQIKRLLLQHDTPACNARDIEQVIHQASELSGLALDRLDGEVGSIIPIDRA